LGKTTRIIYLILITFISHPAQHHFSSPKIGEGEGAYGEDVVFLPTTTKNVPRVRRPGLVSI
jgi:hypothetical protein